jgi:RNA polymerase sigma-70 factor (ECF subfamily)
MSGSAYDIEALLAGSHREFDKMVVAESGRLYRILFRMLGDADETRNVLQETFLQAWQRRESFRREAKFTTWLFAIGLNQARAALRKSKRTTALDEETIDRLQPAFTGGVFADPVERWNPHRMAERSEMHRLVHESIAQLPASYRVVVAMKDIEGLSSAEVAEAVGISSGALRVRLHRARQALRSLLERKMADPPARAT